MVILGVAIAAYGSYGLVTGKILADNHGSWALLEDSAGASRFLVPTKPQGFGRRRRPDSGGGNWALLLPPA